MWSYFFDPLHAASIWGSILMCLSSSLMGVIVVIRKESLIGETLSHAALPGVALGICIGGLLPSLGDLGQLFCQIFFAFIFSCLGTVFLYFMKSSLKVKEDAALCFVLSTFVGAGLFVGSILQHLHPLWYRELQLFFYGQAATMRDIHVGLYAALALLCLLFVFFAFPILRIALFDKEYARSVSIPIKKIDYMLIVLISLSVIIGIKAVGIVLMSGMLIAPAIVARAFSHNLKNNFFIAALVGTLAAALGHVLSSEMPLWFLKPGEKVFSLPTGPIILLLAVCMSFIALLFGSKQGIVYRFLALQSFKWQIKEENFIKLFWKKGLHSLYTAEEIKSLGGSYFLVKKIERKGEIIRLKEGWELTPKGRKRAQSIVRVHRLFELYLSSKLNMSLTDVHDIAEEMEHHITPEMERELTALLQDPKADPHKQPIPRRPS
jgi:manganese/zinc/iron transport system permease protein